MSDTSTPTSLNRRKALGALTSGLVALPHNKASYSQALAPGQRASYRIPGEFEPSQALWLSYDAGHKDLTASLFQALSPHVKLKLLVANGEDVESARNLLDSKGIRVPDLSLAVWQQTKYFLRDVTSFAVGGQGRLGAVNFRWSEYGLPGWCQRRYAGQTEKVRYCSGDSNDSPNETCKEISRLRGAALLPSELFIEGGALEVNGMGLIIANEALLKQRNPGVARAILERHLLSLPGVRKAIWLPEGLAEDPQGRATIVGNYVGWGTGGHTDEFVRFTDAQTVMLAWPDDEAAATHPVARLNRQRMQRNFEILSSATGLKGEKLRVIKMPMPKIIERRVFLSAAANRAWSNEWTADFFLLGERRREGDAVMQVASASYLNFIIANNVVIVPEYTQHGTAGKTQDRVRRIFELVFKDKQIIFVDAISANWVGGGPHCATLKEPVS